MLVIVFAFDHRPATAYAEAGGSAAAQEGGFAGHVYVAEEVRPAHVLHHDGGSGRAAQATLLGVGVDGGDLQVQGRRSEYCLNHTTMN